MTCVNFTRGGAYHIRVEEAPKFSTLQFNSTTADRKTKKIYLSGRQVVVPAGMGTGRPVGYPAGRGVYNISYTVLGASPNRFNFLRQEKNQI